MASSVSTDRLSCRRKILMYKHMPADAKVEAIAKAGTTTETWDGDGRLRLIPGAGHVHHRRWWRRLDRPSIYAAEKRGWCERDGDQNIRRAGR